MAFWTSSEPGVLPKWVFWLSLAVLCADLILVFNTPNDELSAETIAGTIVAAVYVILAKINAIHVLFVLAGLGFAFSIVGAVIVFFATTRQQDGFGILVANAWMDGAQRLVDVVLESLSSKAKKNRRFKEEP